jgi:hypothetical protein
VFGWLSPVRVTSSPPFRIPPAHLLPEQLAAEAIRLGGALAELMPDEPEAFALLALMLLHDSRRAARTRDGEIVLLADQDRSLWDRAQIRAGQVALQRALALLGSGAAGIYCLQARIAALHCAGRSDWAAIAELYGQLARLTRAPARGAGVSVALSCPTSAPRPSAASAAQPYACLPAAIPAATAALDAADEEADQPNQHSDDQQDPKYVNGESEASEDRQYQDKRQQCDHVLNLDS